MSSLPGLFIQHRLTNQGLSSLIDSSRLGIDERLRAVPTNQILVPKHKHRRVLEEDLVHVFQGAARGFGIDEVDDGEVGVAEAGKDCAEEIVSHASPYIFTYFETYEDKIPSLGC